MQFETITTPHQSSRNGKTPQLIVLHIADGTYEGTKSWFENAASVTSSHFIVGSEGQICRCVPLDRMAWCNGTSASAADAKYYGHSTLELVRKNGGNANEYSISIECEGYYAKTAGALTEAQLGAVAELIGYIREQVQELYGYSIPLDRRHICGHCEITPLTRPHCPGEAFPWASLMQRLTTEEAPERIFRVQVGAFRQRENADAMLAQIRAAGFDDAFIQTQEAV